MDVSVIMINYNTYDFTYDAIKSIIKFTKNLNYEIILIDNASTDDSGTKLKESFKEIIYLQANENLGTSKAFNLGLKVAKGKYVIWLNTDILFVDNYLKGLFDFMETNPTCGVCGGNLVDFSSKPCESYQKEIISLKTVKEQANPFFMLFRKIFKKQLNYQYNYSNKPMEVGYITGADMLVRKSILDELKGLDEDIFMYAEEVEFQFRVKKLTDFKIMSVPWCSMKHYGGGSFKKTTFKQTQFEIARLGDLKYFAKSYGDETAVKYLKVLISRYKKLKLLYLFKKNKKSEYQKKIEIINNYLKNYPEILSRRK